MRVDFDTWLSCQHVNCDDHERFFIVKRGGASLYVIDDWGPEFDIGVVIRSFGFAADLVFERYVSELVEEGRFVEIPDRKTLLATTAVVNFGTVFSQENLSATMLTYQ